MGATTAFYIRGMIKKDVPDEVINTLRLMATGHAKNLEDPFRRLTVWSSKQESHLSHDDEGDYTFAFRSDVKDNGCIDEFVEWLTPHLSELLGQFIGFKHYEHSHNPELLYHPNNWQRPFPTMAERSAEG